MVKKKKDWTIKQFIVYFMVFIIIFQALLFTLIMAIGGGLKNLEENSFKPFGDTALLRVKDLETQLTQKIKRPRWKCTKTIWTYCAQ